MTDFEKSIKREMTREKFEAIRDKVYGDGINTFAHTYGEASSWLFWNRDEKGEIASEEPPDPVFTRRFGIYDGSIENWKEHFSSKITTDIVFLGLNASGDGSPHFGPKFQMARGHQFLIETFKNTEAEGTYFTDIIKRDQRFLDHKIKLAKGTDVVGFINSAHGPGIIKDHVKIFKDELDCIGAKKPLLIVFGIPPNSPLGILKKVVNDKFLDDRFYKIVEIYHYTYTFIKGGLAGYKDHVSEKLAPFITIPRRRIITVEEMEKYI